jgi:hypothetical protein
MNATFTADFSSFLDACHQAEIAIKGIDDGAANVTGRLERMANSLSGRQVIQQATLMSEAITRLEGGLASLTPAELERVGAVATEAAAKFKALGQEVPADIQRIADAAKAAGEAGESGFAKLNDALSKVGLNLQVLTVAGAGAAIGRLATDTVAFAGHLNDLSAATGINVTELQRLDYAGQQVGVSLDSVASGVEKLQKNLVAGDAADTVEKLGLNVDALRKMDPGDMFEAISARIAEIPDPAERTATAVALLGKSGAELLPLMTANINELAGGYKGMSKEAVDGLDAIGDAWTRLVVQTKSAVGEAITWIEKYGNSLHRLVPALDEIDKKLQTAMHGPSPFQQVANDVEQMAKTLEAVAPKLPTPAKLLGADTSQVEIQSAKLEAALKKSEAELEQYRQAVKKLADELGGAEAAASVGKLADAVADLTRRFGGLSSVGLADLAKKLQDLRAKGADVSPVLDQMNASQLSLALLFPKTTEALGKQAEMWGTYGHLVAPIPDFMTDVGNKLRSLSALLPKASTDFDQLGTRMQKAFGVQTRTELQTTANTLLAMFAEMSASGRYNAAELEKALGVVKQAFAALDSTGQKTGVDLAEALTVAGKSFAQLAQIGGGAFPEIARNIGSVVTAVGAVTTAMQNLTSEKGGFNAANLTALATGWVGVAVVAYQVATAIYSWHQKQKALNAALAEGTIVAFDFGRTAQQAFSPTLVKAIDDSSNSVEAFLQRGGLAGDQLEVVHGKLAELVAGTAKLADVSRALGEALNIVDVVKELGGLSSSNLGMVEARLGDLIDLITIGGPDASKAIDTLSTEIQNLGDYFAAHGDVWDQGFKSLIANAEALGGAVADSATKLLASETDKATKGLTAYLQTGATAYDTIAAKQTELADLQAQYADATADQAPKIKAQIDDTTAALEAQRQILQASGVTTQATAEAAGAALLGTFGLMLKQGSSLVDTIAAVGPGVTALETQLTNTGLTGGDAFGQLQRLVALAGGAISGPALTAVSGLNDALVGLSNTGILNQAMFAGLADQVGQTYGALIDQGADGNTALAAMQPTLQTIWELEQQYGYSVDDATQKLVDQAAAQGIVGEEHKTIAQQMLDATNKISAAVEGLAHAFGVTLPSDMDKTAKAGTDAAKSIADGLGKVPKSLTIDVGYNVANAPGAPSSSGPAATPEYHAMGGIVGGSPVAPTIFTPKGSDTVPAMLTPGEQVLTVDEARAYRAGRAGDTYAINVAISALDTANLQSTVERKVIPLVVDAIRVNRRQARTDFRSVLGVSSDVLGGQS